MVALAVGLLCRSGRSADVVIDPSQTYQTIDGWGHGGGILGGTGGPFAMLGQAIADPINYQYVDYLVDELGLTGSRVWEIGPRIDGTGNDHGDCDEIDWNLFQTIDPATSNLHYLPYLRDRLLAKGIQPSFYSSPGYPTHASDLKPWVMNHPGERAQQIWASALYYKNTLGIGINYAVIYNEPTISYTILADDIKALGPRLLAHGLSTRVQFAECIAPQTDWNYVFPLTYDPEMWPSVGRISYHTYGTADPYRTYLRDFGSARGLTTAQTEMGDPSFDDLYSDLTLGGVTYWEVAYAAPNTLAWSPGLTSFAPAARFFRLRQLIHYVPPGSVRIGTGSSDPAVRTLAFTRNGGVTTVIENTGASPQTVNLSGLPPGQYGVSQSGGSPYLELGIRTVGPAGTLSVANVTGGFAVTTVYPYSAPNHPPTIQVWGSTPGFLVAPTATATLTVTANDAELNPLAYAWSVASQPAGAAAILATPSAASTFVSGLTLPGMYVFNIAVSDGTSSSLKKAYLAVYDSTPPPVIGQTGFRIDVPYGLVFGEPGGTTHANIEQPISSVILQAGISDLAGSDFTGRGQWSIVSQPAGASATVSSTTYIYVSLRATASNMTVPGDYVFQIDVTNPGHPPLTAQVICTVHPASTAPTISPIVATPAALTLPTTTTQLSAVTSSSTDQVLRHWWVLKTGPAGAAPIFDHQGLANTGVSNLLMPGSYTFTLRAFDDLHMTTLDKTVVVSAAPGAPVITSAVSSSVILGVPFSYQITATNSPTSFGATKLAPGLGFSNGTISGTLTSSGRWNMPLTASNASGTGNANLALTVSLPAPVIDGPLAVDGMANVAFTYSISASNCPGGYSATGLPAGLTINAGTGIISGTPSAPGIYNVTITATNTNGTDTETLTIAIYASAPPTPVITSPSTAAGAIGTAFNYTITATNTPTRYLAVGLPAGLKTDPATPDIKGIPQVSGAFNITLEAGNRAGTSTAPLTLTIVPPASVTESLKY